jgi:hypothetical protein
MIRETRPPLYSVVCDYCEFAIEGERVPLGWQRIIIETHEAQVSTHACPRCAETGVQTPTLNRLKLQLGLLS